MRLRAIRQKSLFEIMEAAPVVKLPDAVQHEVVQRLRQWMQALAKAISQERADEQN
jgi:hypothetical protein